MKCKLCGIEVTRVTNNQKYCKKCSKKKKKIYDRNRIRRKRELGTSDFFEHRKKDFGQEYAEIQREMKRIGLR